MKCDLCKKNIKEEGSYIWIDKKLKSYCLKCSPKIERMNNLPEVMIVPINPKNFLEVVKSNFYSHPINYGRKGGKFIAFYVTSPTSAITHFYKVKLIIKEKDKKIYFLEDLITLKNPILRGTSSGIQGTQNTTLKRIKSAKTIKELS
jgi:hypothetical protein